MEDLAGNTASIFTPREFVEMLKEDPNYHGGNIRLLACESGSDKWFAAQYIANELGVEVLAPTEKVWVFPDGKFTVGTKPYANDGIMKVFKPRKGRNG